MDAWLTIAFLYAIGAAVLALDLFLPSHGVLLAIGLALFGYGLYEAFTISFTTGLINAALLVVALPTGFVIAIRNWHRTPIGRRISPPNPHLTEQDRLPLSDLGMLVGRRGRSMTLLRPVGTCEFDGRRVECKSEYGIIDGGVEVEAVGLSDRTVVVRPVLMGDSPSNRPAEIDPAARQEERNI